jgi:hypothetical protein
MNCNYEKCTHQSECVGVLVLIGISGLKLPKSISILVVVYIFLPVTACLKNDAVERLMYTVQSASGLLHLHYIAFTGLKKPLLNV